MLICSQCKNQVCCFVIQKESKNINTTQILISVNYSNYFNLWSKASKPIPSQKWLNKWQKISFMLKIRQFFGDSRWFDKFNITMLLSDPLPLQSCTTPAGGTLNRSCTNKMSVWELPLFYIQPLFQSVWRDHVGKTPEDYCWVFVSFMFLWDSRAFSQLFLYTDHWLPI